jgi:hypothetical protein
MLLEEIRCRTEAGLLDVAGDRGVEVQIYTFKIFAVC